MTEKSFVKEVAETETDVEPDEVVVDDDELLLQAATRIPLAATIVARARFRVSFTLPPLAVCHASAWFGPQPWTFSKVTAM
jgi:hypothetical protein